MPEPTKRPIRIGKLKIVPESAELHDKYGFLRVDMSKKEPRRNMPKSDGSEVFSLTYAQIRGLHGGKLTEEEKKKIGDAKMQITFDQARMIAGGKEPELWSGLKQEPMKALQFGSRHSYKVQLLSEPERAVESILEIGHEAEDAGLRKMLDEGKIQLLPERDKNGFHSAILKVPDNIFLEMMGEDVRRQHVLNFSSVMSLHMHEDISQAVEKEIHFLGEQLYHATMNDKDARHHVLSFMELIREIGEKGLKPMSRMSHNERSFLWEKMRQNFPSLEIDTRKRIFKKGSALFLKFLSPDIDPNDRAKRISNFTGFLNRDIAPLSKKKIKPFTHEEVERISDWIYSNYGGQE